MASSQISPRFVIFVVVSLLTHLMDVAASGLFCHMLMQQDSLKTPWFSISAGLLIIPLVGLQLISAVYLLRRKGESATTMEVVLTAILHVLQLGFISRHFAILQESSIPSKKYEIAEILVLRMVFSFTSGLPLLLIKLHVLFQDFHEASWEWSLYLTSATALFAVTWALATFRRRLSDVTIDSSLITFPGTLLKFLWRAGEITTRVIALSLFASLYTYWLFLVIGLHWFSMLVCVCVPAITPLDVRSNSFAYRFFYSIVVSFTYIFVFINTTSENTVFRYTFYYIIFFLENTVLVTVWSVQASSEELGKYEAFVYVAAISFLISIISMIVYYKFFHVAQPKENETATCDSTTCASCKLNIGNNHPPIPPRPGASGHWLSQYHTAIYCGQYCKHHGQDSLLDSTSEKNSILTVSSSHARLQQKLATINDDKRESVPSSRTSKTNSASNVDSSTSEPHSVSSRSKSRKKNKKKNELKSRSDSGKTSSSKSGGNNSEDSGSQKQPVWLPSGDSTFANQLLTYSLDTFDTNDTADDERSSVATGVQDMHFRREISSRELSSVHKHMDSASWSAPKRGEDRHWYSDGYSTDRTLDWANFPVNSLQRNMYNASLDTDEDHHLNCHECSHGDSEVSSIMRSLDDVPETFPSGRRSREISPRDRSGEDHRNHHHRHHQHHHLHPEQSNLSHQDRHRPAHRHKESLNSDSKPKASQISNDFSLKDTDKSNNHSSKSQRTHMLSSPASDPSHGPKSKRKGSPKRRIHGSAHPDRSASKNYVTDQSNIQHKIHAETLSSRSPVVDNRMIQSEQIATDLLAKSMKSNKSKKQKSSQSAPTSDPRFNVRVMVTDAAESTEDNKYDAERSQEQSASAKNVREEKRADNQGKKKILGVTEKETDVDRYVASTDFEEGEDPAGLSRLADKIGSSEKRRSSQSAQSSDVQTTSIENSPVSAADDGKEEAIYENIWQVKEDDKAVKSKLGVKNLAFVEDEPRKLVSNSSSGVRDAWYMCSESEDSALPPEALSSSVDGFTASENGSDVSVEIVI